MLEAGGVGVAVGQVSGATGRAVPGGVAADGATVGMAVPGGEAVGDIVALPCNRPQAHRINAVTSEIHVCGRPSMRKRVITVRSLSTGQSGAEGADPGGQHRCRCSAVRAQSMHGPAGYHRWIGSKLPRLGSVSSPTVTGLKRRSECLRGSP